jgi:hypothetical protein
MLALQDKRGFISFMGYIARNKNAKVPLIDACNSLPAG